MYNGLMNRAWAATVTNGGVHINAKNESSTEDRLVMDLEWNYGVSRFGLGST